MSKYIFVTGGVVSSLGKGICGASIGRLLQMHGYKVNMIKFDPYINVDPGHMDPFQHGEVYVTSDGAEADLDLGTYERFLDIQTTRQNTNTSGKVYQKVINDERAKAFCGGTVQVIPHITNEIKSRFSAFEKSADITIIEIGGTIGDIEGLPFIEAARQFMLEQKREDVLNVHVSYVPYIAGAHELKTKPTQHSVIKLREFGIIPGVIICRTEHRMSAEMKDKLALFCNVDKDAVVESTDCPSIYQVPEALHNQNVDKIIMKLLNLKPRRKMDTTWFKEAKKVFKTPLKIAVVGKYDVRDAYKSIDESLKISALSLKCDVSVSYILSQSKDLLKKLKGFDGIVIPGNFDNPSIGGELKAIEYARKNSVPLFAIGIGMQCAVIEFARNVLGFKTAHSTRFLLNTPYPVIDYLGEVAGIRYKNNLRLGGYDAVLKKNSLAHKLYKKDKITERHRHKYEINPEFIPQLEKAGLRVAAYHKNALAEIVELEKHPFFMGVSFQAEFGARPMKPHPLFEGFIAAALKYSK
ncbi:MAG: CTP synthase [Elusimicrobia bacterium]|nr:CTP synthase [Elusimicrobiota bacterium]